MILNYSDYMQGEYEFLTEEDKDIVKQNFDIKIEMTVDEFGRVFNEVGVYIADIVNI